MTLRRRIYYNDFAGDGASLAGRNIMFCKYCGKELDEHAAFCPNCGAKNDTVGETAARATVNETAAANHSAPSDNNGKANKLGIAGFVVSLISLGLGYYYAIASIVGLVLSAVAFGTRKKYDKYNGFALAGMIIGIVSTVIWVIVYIYVFIVIFALISIGGSC